MKNDLNSQEVAKMIGGFIGHNKADLVNLMNKYGANVSLSDDNKKISAALVVLLQKPAFVKGFTDMVRSTLAHPTARSLVNFTGNDNFMSATGYTGIGPSPDATLSGASALPNASSTSTPSNFSDYLKNIFTPQRIGELLDTGVGIFASSVKSQNDQKTAQKLIDLNTTTPMTGKPVATGSGMSTTVKVVIAVGVIGSVVALYYAFKKK